MSEAIVIDAVGRWGLEPARLRPDIPIEGSPERCDYRTVLEDRAGRTWVVELIVPGTRELKLRIAANHYRNGEPLLYIGMIEAAQDFYINELEPRVTHRRGYYSGVVAFNLLILARHLIS